MKCLSSLSLSITLAAGLYTTSPTYAADTSPKILGYLQGTSLSKNAINKLDQIDLAFANPSDDNGNLDASASKYLKFVNDAKKINPRVKIYLALGGWATTGGSVDDKGNLVGVVGLHYVNVLTNDEKRKNFIKNIINIVEQSHLDGIDVDLESYNFLKLLTRTVTVYNKKEKKYTTTTIHYFTRFVTELKAALASVVDKDGTDKPISSARARGLTAAVMIGNGTTIEPVAYNAFDYIGMMSYDGPGADFSSLNFAKRYFNCYTRNPNSGDPDIGVSIPNSKLYVGVPFYGQKGKNTKTFKEIYSDNKNAVNNDVSNNYYYNGQPTIHSKAEMVRKPTSNGSPLAGLMIWALEQDSGDILINTVYNEFHPDTPPPPPSGFQRYINLNGNSETFEGHSWTAYTSATNSGLTVDSANDGVIERPSATTFIPTPDAAKNNMLNTFIRTTGSKLRLHQANIPSGTYTVKLWMMENIQPNYRSFSVKLENVIQPGTAIGSNIGVGLWINYPYSVRVTDGTLDIELTKSAGSLGTPQLMGLEITGSPTGISSLEAEHIMGSLSSIAP